MGVFPSLAYPLFYYPGWHHACRPLSLTVSLSRRLSPSTPVSSPLSPLSLPIALQTSFFIGSCSTAVLRHSVYAPGTCLHQLLPSGVREPCLAYLTIFFTTHRRNFPSKSTDTHCCPPPSTAVHHRPPLSTTVHHRPPLTTSRPAPPEYPSGRPVNLSHYPSGAAVRQLISSQWTDG